MNKKAKYSNSGMRQDISNSKFDGQFYFEGMNIRVLASDKQSSGAITNTKGNEFLLKIPTPVIDALNNKITYNGIQLNYTNLEIDNVVNSNANQIIIGNCKTKNGFVIFSTNNNGLDCIWFLNEETLVIKLLYLRDLDFNTAYPIQAINNYENSKIDKVYWVNSKDQLRFLNINHSVANDDLEELIDLSISSINIVADINFSKINIEEISYGGKHTSGMIQYGYSYYKINGSESIISPLSNLIPLGKSVVQGGNLNEIVGTIPKIVIDDLDIRFTNIKLYAIKYTSLNELPSVNVIADRSIVDLTSFVFYDNGSTLYPSTIEDIALDFNKIIIPKHIESKNNRLFAFNYKDKFYKLSQTDNNLDCRAYSFPISSGSTTVYSEISNFNELTEVVTGTSTPVTYASNILLPNFLNYNNASINGNYRLNKYQPNSNRLGGEGYYLKYEIIRTNDASNEIYDYRFFKDNELYRLGLQFYNKYGVKSTPNWIADYVVSPELGESNLSGFYAGIKLTLKPEFFIWLNDQSNFLDKNGVYDSFLKPVGFKLIRGDRTVNDKSIVSQGLINGMMAVSAEKGFTGSAEDIRRANTAPKCPSLMRRFDNYLCPMYKNLSYDRIDNNRYGIHPQWRLGSIFEQYSSIEAYSPKSSENQRTSMYQFNQLMQFYTPEITFNMLNNVDARKINVVGGIVNNFNATKARYENWTQASFFGYTYFENVLSPYDIKNTGFIGLDYNRRGIYGPDITRSSAERNDVISLQYFREYTGDFIESDTKLLYNVYGKPEIVESNQGIQKYNNDSELSYVNNMTIVRTGIDTTEDDTALDFVVNQGTRSAIFALGDVNDDTKDRTTIEDIFNDTNIESNITSSPVVANPLITINKVVATSIEAALTAFDNEYLGVLETNNVFFNNNLVDVVSTFNTENVDLIFDSIGSYNSAATATVDDWTGLKVTIVDGVNNNIYTIIDQLLGLPGLTDTLLNFNYMIDSAIAPIDQFLLTLDNLNDYNTALISDGFTIGVIEDSTRYEYDTTTSSFLNLGNYSLPVVSTDYQGGAGLIVEFVNDEKLKYIGSYYGGNSYESKTKTVYVDASNYFSLSPLTSVFNINDPGDTFVQEYSLLKLAKTEQLPVKSNYKRISEIIKVRLEGLVNQNKRNDESRFEWNEPWQPSQGDYHVYNRVYSQSPNLIRSQDTSYEVKQNELYDSSIIASGFKRPGEIIDSWSNFNILDTMHLEGKYGSINAVVKHNDEIITFQDSAIAQISINPRVQIQADDGIDIKLGTGDLLDDYKYINTNSGTLNKYGVIGANSGIFYYDTINNSLNTISDNNKLSDLKYLHSFFQKNINNNLIKLDNHILKNGIQFGYDYLNNDIYFTFLQGSDSITINFNEMQNEFISLHGFKPSFYFNKGNIFLTTHPDNNNVYAHKEGIYNIFYESLNPSYVIYNLNPEPDTECIFDNIDFQSECYLGTVEQPNKTINKINAYNEYQNSGLIDLIPGRSSNLRRKFREWNAIIPREGRTRIRGPYSKLKLQFDNDNDYKLILHDVILGYTS